MKILLRHVETGNFLSGPNRWTADLAAAFDWKNPKRLLDYVKERGLEGMDIGVLFPGCDAVKGYPLKEAMQVACILAAY